MGRKAGVSPEETRAAVLDAALETFAVFGYHGASTRAIGTAADLTIGAVHHHFGSKEKLYAKAVEEAGRRLSSMFETALKSFGANGIEGAVYGAIESLRDPYYAFAARLVSRHAWEDLEADLPRRLNTEGTRHLIAGKAIAALAGTSEIQGRLRVQTAIHSLARFLAAPPEEHCFLAGVEDPEEARRILEQELGNMIVSILSK